MAASVLLVLSSLSYAAGQSLTTRSPMADLPLGMKLEDIPQDPFWPKADYDTPSFMDTALCVCALRYTPNVDLDSIAWQCIGDQIRRQGVRGNETEDVYQTTTGKWFGTSHGGTNLNLTIDDASNGPDTSKLFRWNGGSLVGTSDQSVFNVYDRACTASNQTTYSTAFYKAIDERANNAKPINAAPCWRPGAVPLEIQDLDSWTTNGCNEGFLCANNTVNALPQFCPPITECQASRLLGVVCHMGNGTNIGMGPFEPVICQAGHYCPKGASIMLPCPVGSYCQPGAATPTPCSIGSQCPAGSSYERNLIPIVLMLVIDVALLMGTLLFGLRNRLRRSANAHSASVKARSKGGLEAMSARSSGYSPLDDETGHDQEMLPMNPGNMRRADTWGFHAVLDMGFDRQTRVEQMETAKGMTPELQVFVESMRKATDAAHFGLSFTYSSLSYQPKKSPRMILQNVTGSIERGSVTAVMGGSGAGKSTFVNVLMGKTSHTGGSVAINGIPGKLKRYKKLIGYVPQDDIVLPELTVYENILHSARVRLPRTWKDIEVVGHVNAVIECLELSHVKDSLIGTIGKPVISGGQRKRVSIGMELAAAPMAIFLDEPTSGLDATAASSIMGTLKAISCLGISVVVIIHQPRMEIFEMLDNLVLLADGQLIYEGLESEVRQFFEASGYIFPPHSNYGDVVTDIITGNGRAYKSGGDVSKESLIRHWANSRQFSERKSRPGSIVSINTSSTNKILKTRGASRARQTYLCLLRAMLQQYRTKGVFWSEMALASVAGFLIGLALNSKEGVLFQGLHKAPYEVLSVAQDLRSTPELALLTAIAIGLVSAAPGVKIFSEEMLLHRREAEAGHSRLAYFLAKSLSAIPRMILGCLHVSAWCLLLSVPVVSWYYAFMVNLLYFYCIYGLASFLSMILRREDAPLFSTLISLIVGVLCGASPPLSKVRSWHLEWLWRASPSVWLAEVYFGQMVSPFDYLYDVEFASDMAGYNLHWFKRNLAVLFLIGTIYRILAFVGLFAGKRLRV